MRIIRTLMFLVVSSILIQVKSIRLTEVKDELNVQFEQWKSLHNKNYPSVQIHFYRMNIFAINRIKVQQHNQMYYLGHVQYTLELNKFADLTKEQWKSIFGRQNFIHRINQTINNPIKNIRDQLTTSECLGFIADAPNPPQELDWTTKAVTPIQDQKNCGSNWAFVSTGAIEGLYALKKGKLIKFSQQQLIDCSHDYGNQGCGGGFMEQAFWYTIDNGITSNQLYPYKAIDATCKYSSSMKITQFQRCARIPSGNYSKLLSAIVQQPTSVAVDSSDFQLYSSGIYNGNCTTDINHGMLLVGYGGGNTTHYWKLKNSLGTSWGMKGYILIHKTEDDGQGKCGIQIAASLPQIIF